MKTLYLDESGNSTLKRVDKTYSMFVLGGVIIDDKYIEVLKSKINDFKEDIFKKKLVTTSDVILHTLDIKGNTKGFEPLEYKKNRNKFYKEINKFLEDSEFSVLSCAFHTKKVKTFIKKHDIIIHDLYNLGFSVLAGQFARVLKDSNETGYIIAEAREDPQNEELEKFWEKINNGKIKKHIKDFDMADKKGNLVVNTNKKNNLAKSIDKESNSIGLQMADLVINPIGRYVLGRPNYEGWEIVREKLEDNQRLWLESKIENMINTIDKEHTK